MRKSIYPFLTVIFLFVAVVQGVYGQQHDRNWLGRTIGVYGPVFMRFDENGINYEAVPQSNSDPVYIEAGAHAMSNAAGELQFYTNGNVVVSHNYHIMEGGKGFNEGSEYDDFGTWAGDTVENIDYLPYTYQLIPDAEEEGTYYMLHSFFTYFGGKFYYIDIAPKMQISKIDMKANGGLGKVVYKNRYFEEEQMGAAFAVVRHGNGRDWWLVRRSPDGLYFRSTLLHRDTVVQTVESTMQGINADWYNFVDSLVSATNLLDVSPDGSMLLDNYGVGHAKLMGFDRCSGEVSLIDTFSTGIVPLETVSGLINCINNLFAFSPSGQYLYGTGWAEFAQWDLWSSDIRASKLRLGGVPWGMDDFQNVMEGFRGGSGVFANGPDGKLYSLGGPSHNVIEYPDMPGEASGYCIAAENPPSCIGVPYYMLTTPYPNYRLGPSPGSGCDTILSSTEPPLAGSPTGASGYGVSASHTVASGQVEVSITLPTYGTSTAELQVVDMLGRVVHQHRFSPYAYLHTLEVSGWPAGLYNVVLLENGRARAGARIVVGR